MTVKELIENLQTLDPELRVFVEGYEGGYNDVSFNPNISKFVLDYHSDWYYGVHEIIDACSQEEGEYHTVDGIVL